MNESAGSVSAPVFFAEARRAIDQVEKTQLVKIQAGARLIADSLGKDGVVHIFGTGHSQAFAMEMAGRAGGLIPMHMMRLEDLVRKGGHPWSLLDDPMVERDPRFGHELIGLYHIQPNDAFVIVSNSGRNGSTVEMALEVKRRGMPLIIVTSLAHSQNVSSRHPSGKRLFEIGDVVIDNGGPYGDALLEVPGSLAKVCAISSVTGATIAQALTAETIRLLTERGTTPPVYISYNVDGADEWNTKLVRKYGDRIS
ncbi:MAG: sugar isomerase domain-containing protein [Symbiobacteriia bacterium]